MISLIVTKAKNEREKMLGLIGQKKAYPFLLETHFGIHTFGVKFPIDVVILSNDHHVITFYETMKPNRVWLWNPKYKFVLELPAGEIKKKKITIGKKMKLVIK